MKVSNKLYVPLIIIEVYLLSTLILYQFGPIKWNTESPVKFWTLIFFYHCAFIAGYIISIKKHKIKYNNKMQNKVLNFISKNLFWIFLICTICSFVMYRNVTHNNNWIPLDFFQNFINGLLHPGSQYYSNITNTNYVSSKIITMVFALFAFIYQSLFPLGLYFWKELKIKYRIWFIALLFFYFGTYVSIGTNKGIFNVMFILLSTFFICVSTKDGMFKRVFNNKKIIMALVGVMLFTISFFGWTMYSRNNTHTISDNGNINDNKSLNEVLSEYVGTLLYRVDDYLTQGYYGMSLALDEPFTTTYGIGNSDFLKSNFKSLFNIDVSNRTYQYKTNSEWNSATKWHSFYGYWANDISFYGVILLMFIIGYYFALIWKDILFNHSLIAISLFPLFAIMFFNMPGNNMVFTSMQLFCAFWELTVLYIWEKVKMK